MERARDLRTTRGPHQRPLTRRILKFDLAQEADALRLEEGWRNSGHSAKSLAKHGDRTIVLIAIKRETRIKEHQTDGAVSIHVLAGHIAVHVGTKTIDAPIGSLIAFDRGVPHDVEALEDSTFVLSVCARLKR